MANGINALLQGPRYGGIDFMAIARGEQIARDQNWQDIERAQKQDQFALQREVWQDRMQEIQQNRAAQAYTAPMITNLQAATSAGLSPSDYLIQQREQVLSDPAFQNFTPEIQQRVLNSLAQPVRAQLQDLQRTGDLSGAMRLAQAYGLASPVGQLEVATAQGDPDAILGALRSQFGTPVEQNPDGTVTFAGVTMPAIEAAQLVANSQSGASLLAPGLRDLQQQQGVAQEEANFLRDLQRMQSLTAMGVPQAGVAPSLANPAGIAPQAGAVPQAPASPAASAVSQALGVGQPTAATLPQQLSPEQQAQIAASTTGLPEGRYSMAQIESLPPEFIAANPGIAAILENYRRSQAQALATQAAASQTAAPWANPEILQYLQLLNNGQ